MSDQPQPVPDEIWEPLKRRVEASEQLMAGARWLSWAGIAVSVVDSLFGGRSDPMLVIRLAVPLVCLATITFVVAVVRVHRAMQKMRRLMIEYHGVDPGPGPL